MTNVEILVKEYEFLKTSFNDVLKEYRKQSNILNTYVTLFLGLAAFVFSNGGLNEKIASYAMEVLIPILSISGFLMIYFYSTILDIIYHLYIIEAQLCAVEIKINEEVGKDLLNYDSKVIPLFNEETIRVGEWINPSYLLGFIGFLFMLLFALIHIASAILFTRNPLFQTIYCSLLGMVIVGILFQFYQLNGNGRIFIKRKVAEINGFQYSQLNTKNVLMQKSKLYFVPIVTFFVGFFAFFIFSLVNNAFYPDSAVDIPLIFQYTIMIGDSIFLPIINFMYFRLVYEKIGIEILKKYKSLVTLILLGVFLLSIIINITTHFAWAADEFTDFIAYQTNTLSFGGWWHLIFSIFQSTILLSFPLFWYIAIKEKDIISINYSRKLWLFATIFGSLMIFNFLHQRSIIYGDLPFFKAIIEAKFTFFNIITSLVILLVMENIYKNSLKPTMEINNESIKE